MAVEIQMPQLSDTMHEGKILSWRKKEGDKVSRGDALAEVATDKADLEVESFHDGVLLKILAPEGSSVKVGTVIAVVGAAGEVISASSSVQKAESKPSSVAASPSVPSTSSIAQQKVYDAELPAINGDSRKKISPLAKNLARAFGVDPSAIAGSGEGGRVTKRDIEARVGREVTKSDIASAVSGSSLSGGVISGSRGESSLARSTPAAAGSVQPLSRMRQTIATKMVESVNSIPHFYVSAKIEVTPLIKLRASLKQLPQYEGITFTHLLLRACSLALRTVPRINASFSDNQLLIPEDINIGIVTALPDGLLIPVLKRVDHLSLADIVSEGVALIKRARAGKPKQDDLVGGTFSISNLGSGAVSAFTAIINPGQGAILAVGSITEEPVVAEGVLKVGKTMTMTLSVDHRILDGVVAAEFLTHLKQLIEEPVLLLA